MGQTVFECISDYEGKVIATLCEFPSEVSKTAVLSLHGYIDYFFHDHVAKAFNEASIAFFALDLRKYGRSLLSHQTPFYCRSLEEYFEEIDLSLDRIRSLGYQKVILMGHSMGGLLATYYLNKGKKRDLIAGSILNAPHFDFYATKIEKLIVPVLAKAIGSFFPFASIPLSVSPWYPKSLHKDFFGIWDFDTTLKPISGVPTYFVWLSAVRKVQRFVMTESSIDVPILVLHPESSTKPGRKWKEAYHEHDIVLNTKDMVRWSKELGKQVELAVFKGGKHDVTLSEEKVRNLALSRMTSWVNQLP